VGREESGSSEEFWGDIVTSFSGDKCCDGGGSDIVGGGGFVAMNDGKCDLSLSN